MTKKENNNVKPGTCQHETCDSKATHFIPIKVCGMKILLDFCEKHDNEFMDTYRKQLDALEEGVCL